MLFENLASFDAAHASLKKSQSKCTPLDLEKERQNEKWWERKKRRAERERERVEKGRASDLQKPLSLSLSQPFFLSFSFFLSLCRISPNPPITVMSGWERGRERLCVTGRINGGEGGRNGRRRFITAFYLLWVSLIPWPCADWSVKINSRDQMSGPGVLSVVTLTLRELMCGKVGMWIQMKMPLQGCSYPKHLLVAAVPPLTSY